ncbi:hypothetical protein QQX98_007059 [Neonectria punicea]|uniref:Zn(2)-C6 fungal-type domain-containing protein n=1 Tax=Neonectria punicea TaxID=979145 RepID=A0ABR1GYX6_9HYPO
MPRSRGGCVNCKRRKRKCDEQRPGCNACARRGIQCEGYATALRWTGGIAVRGRFAGVSIPNAAACARAGETRKGLQQGLVVPGSVDDAASASSPGSVPSLHSAAPHSAAPHSAAPHSTAPHPVVWAGSSGSVSASSPSPSDLSSPRSQGLGIERELFTKFLTSGLRRLYTTEAQCWIQPHFEAMALHSPALVTISAAIQAYLDDGQDGPSVSSMEHVDLALQTFRLELARREGAMHAATLCAGLLICTLRLLQAQPWSNYIELIVDAYQLRTRLQPPDHIPIDDMAMRHSLEVMGVMDIPSMAIGRISPPIGIWRLLRKLQDTWKDGRVAGVEVVSGLPRSLLDIFASLLDNDDEYTESRLWTWPGEIGEYLQCHLWDCWRFSGILEVRRRRRMERKRRGSGGSSAKTGASHAAPGCDVILCRLIASMDALNRSFEMPQNEHLLVHNGLMYPMVTASLEVERLKEHIEWRRTLHEVRLSFLRRDSFKLVKATFELLDDAWQDGTSEFDIHEAAKSKGMEIAVF